MITLKSMPTIADIKAQAKRMRLTLRTQGHDISHSQALEIMAHQLGEKDWNTLFASLGNRVTACPVVLGERVKGTYLGQPFSGEVLGVAHMQKPDHYRVTIKFDEPVDVVTFDSFSAYRQRVSATITADGVSPEKTGNGSPQLQLEL